MSSHGPGRRTLAIVKPDAVAAGKVGRILAHLEAEGFTVVAGRFLRLTEAQAQAFYAVHAGKPFFASLTRFMSSGPVLVLALERENAVEHLRKVIGATDPKEAAPGTIRALYAESKERNAIHASDSDATAAGELRFFFSELDLLGG
jgi:nucleoside-diphosphate kinase